MASRFDCKYGDRITRVVTSKASCSTGKSAYDKLTQEFYKLFNGYLYQYKRRRFTNEIFRISTSSDLLKDRIILITGAGDGIGRAAALSYALHGATVVLHGRTLNKLEVIYDEIEGLGAPQPAILPLQLSSASDRDYDF